jgi:uncharacterized protein (DUF924 family)
VPLDEASDATRVVASSRQPADTRASPPTQVSKRVSVSRSAAPHALIARGRPRGARSDAIRIAGEHFGRGLSRNEQMFLYMPFMHSEDIADQDRCMMLFSPLQEWLRYAEEHRDVIRRFGRFPYRNALLGRQSTSEELAFLKESGS